MTEMSRERREELQTAMTGLPENEAVDETGTIYPPGMTYGELHALLSDSAWRERVEREVRELAEKFDRAASQYRAEGLQGQAGLWDMAADKTRAIVDTGRGEVE